MSAHVENGLLDSRLSLRSQLAPSVGLYRALSAALWADTDDGCGVEVCVGVSESAGIAVGVNDAPWVGVAVTDAVGPRL